MKEDDWKKKRGSDFDFFFDFDGMQDMMDELMKSLMSNEFMPRRRNPLVMGFNIKMGPDGKPMVEQFGNVKTTGGKPTVSNAREPLVDVIESQKDITVTAELPGVEKKDIQFSLPKKGIAVIEVRGERSFFKEIKLPATVKKNTAKAKFNNGILEVRLEKEKASQPKKKGEVRIE